MALTYFFVLFLLLGFTKSDTILTNNEPAIIEDLRNGYVFYLKASPSRVVAGWPATAGQIPHQVSLRMVSSVGSVFPCGGSIIHHRWVITAAHCLANSYTFVVRIGLTNLTRPEYIVGTSLKRLHPNYDEFVGGAQTDDIALLGLEHYIPYGPLIQPCRLQSSQQKNDIYTGIRFTVSGYGLTDDVFNGGDVSETLNWVHLRGITNEECLWWYNGNSIIQAQTICAEFYNDTAQSACQGDSGGPLTFVDSDGRPTMVGIVSFGSFAGCNSAFPTAYVRPGHYHDWFRQVTGINFDWTDIIATSALYEEEHDINSQAAA